MSRQHFSVSLVSRVDASRRIDFGDGGWYVRMTEGWDDLPDRKGSPQPLALTHGSSSLDNTRRASASGSLVVRFRGSAEAVAEENAKLLALCAEPLQLWVTDHDGVARGRDVVVESISVRNRHLPDTMVTASITWTAADPRRYERVKQLTADKPMTNTGTAPTSPLLRVEGPAKAPVTVTERPTGRVVSWAGSVSYTHLRAHET